MSSRRAAAGPSAAGRASVLFAAALLFWTASSAPAQETATARPWGADGPLEQITTTATKKSEAEIAQDVPLAISVLSGVNIDALQVTDIEDLSYSLPNVALDSIGTGKGIANFSIRGLGIAGSIPSIDPTVGVFVDGMYLGVNYGVVVDLFDLESVEVLRGPQ
ncbi:MAG: Plug domain-containing protein [Proteobacteria bacterium]|nr:Plug domain-containing protein [Pseudomonadota bacterium]